MKFGLYIVAGGCLVALGCRLERDWAAWQEVLAAGTDGETTSPGPASTGPASTGPAEGSGGSETSTSGGAAGSTGPGSAGAEGSTGPGSTAASTTGPADGTTTGNGATTGPAPVCGDGVVEGDEECDDPGKIACFNCIWDRLVFVTSDANLGGDFALSPGNLDYHCNHLAAVAGLLINSQPRFRAWVSTSTQSAAERIEHSPGRYVLRNGLVFAKSWDALVAGEILNALNVDENGETQNAIVWTDTRPDGSAMPGDHCADWTSSAWKSEAYWGDSNAVDGNWSLYVGPASNPTTCASGAALFCFESP